MSLSDRPEAAAEGVALLSTQPRTCRHPHRDEQGRPADAHPEGGALGLLGIVLAALALGGGGGACTFRALVAPGLGTLVGRDGRLEVARLRKSEVVQGGVRVDKLGGGGPRYISRAASGHPR